MPKRKHQRRVDEYYDGFVFETLEPKASPDPGTPGRWFQHQYRVQCPTKNLTLRIHQHVNQLCVVCLQEAPETMGGDASIDFAVKPSTGPGSKKTFKKQKHADLVLPLGELVTIGGDIVVPCGVYGSVIEVNERLTADLLRSDPLRKGFLAIIRPVGPFPPPPLASPTTDTPSDKDS